jgi:hypothetical protein
VKVIGQKHKSEDLKPRSELSEGAGKPVSNDEIDLVAGQHEQALLEATIGD